MDPLQKAPPTPPNNNKDLSDELAHVNREMYAKNLELAETNKTLSLLRKIDGIILSDVTSIKLIAQQITDAAVSEGEFKAVAILTVDKDENALVRIGVSRTEAILQAEWELQKAFHGLKTSLTDTQNLAVKVVKEKKPQTTDSVFSILTPHFSLEEAQKIQEKLGIQSSLVFPLIVREEVIGTIIVSLGEKAEDVSRYKTELIEQLVRVVGIAINNGLLYQTLQEANERLQGLDKLKDEFVSIASHELKTPMAIIRNYLWMLENKSATLDDAKKKEYMHRTLVSTTRLINLVNDMLNVSRIESGRIEIKPDYFALLDVTHDVVTELNEKAKQQGIHLVVSETTIPQVYADKGRIQEVLINLIGNALKFTPKDGSITISFTQNNDMVETSVTDTGTGIKQEDLGKLFKKFGRIKNTFTAQAETEGTGLGLYICQQYIELFGGKIWVTSEIGKGSTFSFTLPTTPHVKVTQQQIVPKVETT